MAYSLAGAAIGAEAGIVIASATLEGAAPVTVTGGALLGGIGGAFVGAIAAGADATRHGFTTHSSVDTIFAWALHR